MPFTRHLAYHIWPAKVNNDSWKWNVEHLKRYIDQFDGVRSIGIVTSFDAAPAEEVQEAFADTRIDNWIIDINRPNLRECVTFHRLMETLPHGENDITWYGHAKGVRHRYSTIPDIWAHVMYRLCLEFPQVIEEHLQTVPFTGPFKRYCEFKLFSHDCWHYSGTFYWFRNARVFERPEWRDIAPNFFAAIEAWPSRLFQAHETGCLFNDKAGNLYDRNEWVRLRPELVKLGIELDLDIENPQAVRRTRELYHNRPVY